MSLKHLVEHGVEAAFRALDDLKTEMVFTTKNNPEYNPKTSTVEGTSVSTSVFEGVVINTQSKQVVEVGGIPTKIMEVILNKQDITEDYSKFDSITFNGKAHKIVDYLDDGYSITFTVSAR